MTGFTLLLIVGAVLCFTWVGLTVTLPEDPPYRPLDVSPGELGDAAPQAVLWVGILFVAIVVLGLFGASS